MPADSVAASGCAARSAAAAAAMSAKAASGVGAEGGDRHQPRQPQLGAPCDVLGQPEQVRTGHSAPVRVPVHTVLDEHGE